MTGMSGRALVVRRLTGRLLVVDGGPGPWRRRAGVLDGDVRHGAADDRALAVLNRLVGNAWPTPALELLVGPLVLRAEAPLTVAVCGRASSGDEELPSFRPLHLAAGQRLQVAPLDLTATIAVAGGVDAMPGTIFHTDDVITLGRPRTGGAAAADHDLGVDERSELAQGPVPTDDAPLRVLPGPERGLFSDDAWATFLATTWTVSPTSRRLGVRLEGPALPVPDVELTTSPTWTGAVQVPPSGHPIVLGVDSRTTGGYPRLAQVIAVDRFRLGHARPGRPLRFTTTTIDEARTLRRAFAARWQR
jgi:allophanate hydrolase subunit 2